VLQLARDFAAGDSALNLTSRLVLRNAANDHRLFLLVDQMEECFTVCAEEKLREAFINNLVTAATVPGGQTIVLLTLRADFYGHCSRYPKLAALFSDY